MALTEFGQERHDWHAGLAREDDDLAAPCLEGMAAVGRGLPRDGDENGDFMSCLHEPAIQRQQRLAVENDPGRGSGAGWPRGELGIVGQHCSDPHQDRVHPAPELVDEGAGTGRGDPLAVTRSDSGLAVKGHRPLGRDIGEAGGNALQVRRIELGRRASLEPEIDRNPGRTEDRQAATVHAGKRITDCGDDFRNPGLEDRVGTGRRFAVVAARFERHVEGCAPGLGGILKGHDLGVRASEAGMMAQPDDPTLADQDRANHGIGLDGPSSSFRLGQGQIHPGKVGSAHAGGILKAISGRSERW